MTKGIYKRTEAIKEKIRISHLGKKMSENNKETLRKRMKGNTCGKGNKGSKRSKETRKKMGLWQIGRKLSEKTKRKLSLAKKGIKLDLETRKKIGLAHKGKILSEETKKKISEAQKGIPRFKQRGENNPNWKGGITPKNLKIRQSIEMRLWRESVFARDNFTCQKCGHRGEKLNAHHINNFADFPELRTSIENGTTLCEKCHREFHKQYSKKDNTKIQLGEFLNK